LGPNRGPGLVTGQKTPGAGILPAPAARRPSPPLPPHQFYEVGKEDRPPPGEIPGGFMVPPLTAPRAWAEVHRARGREGFPPPNVETKKIPLEVAAQFRPTLPPWGKRAPPRFDSAGSPNPSKTRGPSLVPPEVSPRAAWWAPPGFGRQSKPALRPRPASPKANGSPPPRWTLKQKFRLEKLERPAPPPG